MKYQNPDKDIIIQWENSRYNYELWVISTFYHKLYFMDKIAINFEFRSPSTTVTHSIENHRRNPNGRD